MYGVQQIGFPAAIIAKKASQWLAEFQIRLGIVLKIE
jgi:hypothetical protein